MSWHLSTFALAGICVTLYGCAVPKTAIDQANSSAHLMLALQVQVDEFRDVQKTVADSRLESIRAQRTLIARLGSGADFDSRVLTAAGKDDQVKLFALLQGLSNARADELKASEAVIASMDADLDKILGAIPSTASQVGLVEARFGALGEQRTSAERIQLLRDYAKQVKSSMDEAGKVAPPVPAASAAPAQSASAAAKNASIVPVK